MADGIAAEKLDFWAIPGLSPGPIFLLRAMPLSGRPVLSLMYRWNYNLRPTATISNAAGQENSCLMF